MNFVYSIIVNYHFFLDRLDVYILCLRLAEGPGGGANARLPPLAAPLQLKSSRSSNHKTEKNHEAMLTFKNEMNIDCSIVNASTSILTKFRYSVGIEVN